jgi:hypothetical protein
LGTDKAQANYLGTDKAKLWELINLDLNNLGTDKAQANYLGTDKAKLWELINPPD